MSDIVLSSGQHTRFTLQFSSRAQTRVAVLPDVIMDLQFHHVLYLLDIAGRLCNKWTTLIQQHQGPRTWPTVATPSMSGLVAQLICSVHVLTAVDQNAYLRPACHSSRISAHSYSLTCHHDPTYLRWLERQGGNSSQST